MQKNRDTYKQSLVHEMQFNITHIFLLPQMFYVLQREKQILIVTLLFGCSHDEEIGVRSSALRALGVCVLFPTLKEVCHIGFSIPLMSFYMHSLHTNLVKLMHNIEAFSYVLTVKQTEKFDFNDTWYWQSTLQEISLVRYPPVIIVTLHGAKTEDYQISLRQLAIQKIGETKTYSLKNEYLVK
jgi:hypothetical protein